ncbi:type II secretion system protein [Clostridium sp. AF19-22AC]|jgi:type IV pilus assembly protein PilA|uniref:type II secretion system protein n=1 Tax=Clostridia TaxID=186801 RepID=UPI000E48248B|nr:MULTISPECIES: type II secretion system protein [Clostridia]RHR27151.1 type II secretion system protein [Clostridium sp. AF19-22AC]
MVQKLKELRKNKKGFTLVELIVVLVILGILIALLVPSLTGYIKKADQKVVMAEARNAQMAVQTIASESYDSTQADDAADVTMSADDIAKAAELADVEAASITNVTLDGTTNKIKTMTYVGDKYTITYQNDKWDETTLVKTTNTPSTPDQG